MKKIKRAITAVICAMLLVATMGMTALAASGTLSGSLNGNKGTVTLKNTSGTVNYCTVSLYQYAGSESNATFVSSNGGNISSGNTISTSGDITQSHAKGIGVIYNSASPSSGTAKTYTTYIK